MTFIDFVFSNLASPKTLSGKCLKSLVSEDPSTSNMVNVLNRDNLTMPIQMQLSQKQKRFSQFLIAF